MALKKVLELNADTTISFKNVGDSIQGYYLGVKNTTTDFGPTKLHIFSTENGTVGAWGSSQLDRKLTPTPKGTPGLKLGMLVQAIYTTPSVMKKGKRTAKGFDVAFDDEITPIDVSGFADATVEITEEPSENYAPDEEAQDVDPEESYEEEDIEEAYTPPAPVAHVAAKRAAPATVTAEQKAKSQALMAKARAGITTGKAG